MSVFEFEVRIDRDANVMYLTQSGSGSRTDLLRLRDAYRDEVAKLSPGFVIVHDQRRLEPYQDDALELAQELVELTNEHGARAVVRIVAESLPSSVRVSRVLTTARARYRNIRVTSPEEAQKALDELRG
jgi:hypothetical protein